MKVIANFHITYAALNAGILDAEEGDALGCMICGLAHVMNASELRDWQNYVADAKQHYVECKEHEHVLTDIVSIEVACPSCKGISQRFQLMRLSGMMHDCAGVQRLVDSMAKARANILRIRTQEVPVEVPAGAHANA